MSYIHTEFITNTPVDNIRNYFIGNGYVVLKDGKGFVATSGTGLAAMVGFVDNNAQEASALSIDTGVDFYPATTVGVFDPINLSNQDLLQLLPEDLGLSQRASEVALHTLRADLARQGFQAAFARKQAYEPFAKR